MLEPDINLELPFLNEEYQKIKDFTKKLIKLLNNDDVKALINKGILKHKRKLSKYEFESYKKLFENLNMLMEADSDSIFTEEFERQFDKNLVDFKCLLETILVEINGEAGKDAINELIYGKVIETDKNGKMNIDEIFASIGHTSIDIKLNQALIAANNLLKDIKKEPLTVSSTKSNVRKYLKIDKDINKLIDTLEAALNHTSLDNEKGILIKTLKVKEFRKNLLKYIKSLNEICHELEEAKENVINRDDVPKSILKQEEKSGKVFLTWDNAPGFHDLTTNLTIEIKKLIENLEVQNKKLKTMIKNHPNLLDDVKTLEEDKVKSKQKPEAKLKNEAKLQSKPKDSQIRNSSKPLKVTDLKSSPMSNSIAKNKDLKNLIEINLDNKTTKLENDLLTKKDANKTKIDDNGSIISNPIISRCCLIYSTIIPNVVKLKPNSTKELADLMKNHLNNPIKVDGKKYYEAIYKDNTFDYISDDIKNSSNFTIRKKTKNKDVVNLFNCKIVNENNEKTKDKNKNNLTKLQLSVLEPNELEDNDMMYILAPFQKLNSNKIKLSNWTDAKKLAKVINYSLLQGYQLELDEVSKNLIKEHNQDLSNIPDNLLIFEMPKDAELTPKQKKYYDKCKDIVSTFGLVIDSENKDEKELSHSENIHKAKGER